jgi:PAS domain-containing protein
MSRRSARSKFSTLKQVCDVIPGHLVSRLSRKYGVDKQARRFSAWSHVVSLLYAQVAHAVGLNNVCDGLRLHAGLLSAVRGATPPARNTLSHANKTRPAAMAEELFWEVLGHLHRQTPSFGGRTYGGFPRRFKRSIHVVDTTTIQLVANCIDWARHRRRKAAAKLHLRLDLQSFLPKFAIVDTASHGDGRRAREACAGITAGEICLFDKAYVDFEHLFDLDERGVFWVTRAKDNMKYRCVKRRLRRPDGRILRDDEIFLTVPISRERYPKRLRRIQAIVERDGKEAEMVFLTNNLQWASSTIADLYKHRWAIEAFFKQIKQTLQLCDFLGHSKNAIQWQVWTALLVYVVLRYIAHLSNWAHSFNRLVSLVRCAIWTRQDLFATLQLYGTAGGTFRLLAAPQQAYLPGISP